MVEAIATVAKRLAALNVEGVVFVGGATVELLLTDPAAPSARPTLDVDVVTPVSSRRTFYEIEQKLRAAGYSQPMDGPICRWIVDGVTVDLMPPIDRILGFSNRWYSELIENALELTLPDGTPVRIGDAPYLLASKLEAFHGRGNEDFRFSRDVTDIVTLIDGRPELLTDVERAPAAVREYVASEFRRFLGGMDFEESLSGHLPADDASQRRAPIILKRMHAIAELLLDS